MSYHRYHTDAFVLNTANSGESNKVFSLFTRELGRVEAYAQGVRELKSKLRYGLQPHAYVYVELVRGKGMWRIVNAGPQTLTTADTLHGRALYVRMLSLVSHLIHGESDEHVVFDDLCKAFTFLSARTYTAQELLACEALLVMRILYALGYWPNTDESYTQFLTENTWSESLIHTFMPIRRTTLPDINRVLRETQL